jgi:hypothetical protein
MATLIFAQAKAIRKKAKAAADSIEASMKSVSRDEGRCTCQWGSMGPKNNWRCKCLIGVSKRLSDEEIADKKAEIYDSVVASETEEFRAIMEIARDLTGVYKQVTGLEVRSWVFLTVRPDMKKIEFNEFRSKIVKKINDCKRVLEATYSFEQKGTSLETLGNGFHVHIMMWTTWAYPSEAKRDFYSAVKDYTGPKSIDARAERDPAGCIQRYLVDYKSEDEHKEETKVWDMIWREQKGLKNLYYKNRGASGSTGLLSDQGGGQQQIKGSD